MKSKNVNNSKDTNKANIDVFNAVDLRDMFVHAVISLNIGTLGFNIGGMSTVFSSG